MSEPYALTSASLASASQVTARLVAEPRGNNLGQCQDCGACLSRCPLGAFVPEMNPRKFLHLLRNGAEDVALASRLVWTCTLCNRCTHDCPTGVLMEEVMRAARGVLSARGEVPEPLATGIASRLATGNVSEVPPEEYIEHAEWMAEELGAELEDPSVTFPMDQAGARYLYLPNPRELTVNPGIFTANLKILHLLKEPWTLSSACSDVTNWGYFTGDDEAARKILGQVVIAAEKLGIETLVMTECGHGYKSYTYDAERWLGRPLPFKVEVISRLAAQGIQSGTLRVDPKKNPGLHTYHDPCNMGRKADLIDPPRVIMNAAVEDFVELAPTRMESLCCGGGGGVDRVPMSNEVRNQVGGLKIEQIKRSGADIVVTGCLSCQSTLGALAKHHKHKLRVLTLGEAVANALV